jgi:uncharacterized Tic20 family protein
MVCPLCGYGTNPPGARFCAGCGRLMDQHATANVRHETAASGAARSASPWTHGAVGGPAPPAPNPADRSPGSAPTTTPPDDTEQPPAASPRAESTATARPAPPPSPNGRATPRDAFGRARAGSEPRPLTAPRRDEPRSGDAGGGDRRDAPPAGEPFGLPAGVAALASSSRTWAVAAPLSALVAGFMSGIPALFGALGADVGARAGLGGLPAILGPLLIWQMRQKDDPFSAQHALNALNFNLTVLTLAFGLTLFTTLTWGVGALIAVPVGIALVVGWLVCSAIATSRAWKGQTYRYPLAFRFARNQ